MFSSYQVSYGKRSFKITDSLLSTRIRRALNPDPWQGDSSSMGCRLDEEPAMNMGPQSCVESKAQAANML